MTRTRGIYVGLLAAALVIGVTGPEPVGAAPRLRGGVFANGGNRSTGPGIQHYNTIGQAIVGLSTGANTRLYHGFWSFGGSRVVSVDPPGPEGPPLALSIGPAHPNPVRDVVHFSLALPEALHVRLEVFDIAGRAVGDAIDRQLEAGYHDFDWKAPQAAAGIYFARLSVAGKMLAERKLVLAP